MQRFCCVSWLQGFYFRVKELSLLLWIYSNCVVVQQDRIMTSEAKLLETFYVYIFEKKIEKVTHKHSK